MVLAESISYLINDRHSGLSAAVEMGEGVTAYVCEDGYCFILGEGEITEADTTNW
ncbi:MAG: hypothetical protein LUD81_10470 [Clostridiales bacterium]|nr:hypothetical protein [Clostridiales bacterium]